MSIANFDTSILFTRDNLDVLRNMNSECVDLIYLDPPFNSNKVYINVFNDDFPFFDDIWKFQPPESAWLEKLEKDGMWKCIFEVIEASGFSHSESMKAYLVNMTSRLFEMHRVLKPTGTIYLHCDHTASHYLKIIMDCIFEKDNFRNEIIWCYAGGGQSKNDFPKKHDTIFRYSKTNEYVFNGDDVRVPYDSDYKATVFAGDDTRAPGKTYKPNPKGKIVEDWWRNIPRPYGEERTGYPTQKPLALLHRIIKASSNKGDIVLDPFCGCATAMVAAEQLERRWVGIDISWAAVLQVNKRMTKHTNLFEFGNVHSTPKLPKRTDGGTPISDPLTDGAYQKDSKDKVKNALYVEQNGYCNGCGIHFPIRNLTIDHIQATSKGGDDTKENKQLLCAPCNSTKNAMSMRELEKKLKDNSIGKYNKYEHKT